MLTDCTIVFETSFCKEAVECGEKTPYQEYRTVRCTKKATCFIQSREKSSICIALCETHTVFPAAMWKKISEEEFILVQVMGA